MEPEPIATQVDKSRVKRAKAGKLGESLYDGKVLSPQVDIDRFDSNERQLEYASIALVIIVPVALTVGIWWFAKFLQVTPDTGMSIFVRACFVVAASVLLVKTRLSTLQGVIPLVLFGLCWSLYPAFDYWIYG